jgi:hypothetical protein
MGSGASTREEKRAREGQRIKLMRGVERFVINCYATCPRLESMKLILSSEMARKAFHNFVKSEHADESFNLYWDGVKLLTDTKKTPYQKSLAMEQMIKTYILPETGE